MTERERISRAVRNLGDAFTPAQIAATRELYAPIALRPEHVQAIVTRDIQYGPDARQRLDIFASGPSRGLPVVVFVHGGGFIMGDKGGAGEPFFNNVGSWAVASGFVGVTMTYRMAPLHVWPAGAVDVLQALGWLRQNIHEHGGDPARIVLVGHSAGAAHVAGCLAGHGGDIRAAMPAAAAFLSGIFTLQVYHGSFDYQVYFGADRGQDQARSTAAVLGALQLPTLFTISELDPAHFHRHLASVVAERVAAQSRFPEVLWQGGHNHVSVAMQIGSSVDHLGGPLADFIRQRT